MGSCSRRVSRSRYRCSGVPVPVPEVPVPEVPALGFVPVPGSAKSGIQAARSGATETRDATWNWDDPPIMRHHLPAGTSVLSTRCARPLRIRYTTPFWTTTPS
jgi:hypothetical protein